MQDEGVRTANLLKIQAKKVEDMEEEKKKNEEEIQKLTSMINKLAVKKKNAGENEKEKIKKEMKELKSANTRQKKEIEEYQRSLTESEGEKKKMREELKELQEINKMLELKELEEEVRSGIWNKGNNEKMCRQFMQKGECVYGKECKFEHKKVQINKDESLEYNRLKEREKKAEDEDDVKKMEEKQKGSGSLEKEKNEKACRHFEQKGKCPYRK